MTGPPGISYHPSLVQACQAISDGGCTPKEKHPSTGQGQEEKKKRKKKKKEDGVKGIACFCPALPTSRQARLGSPEVPMTLLPVITATLSLVLVSKEVRPKYVRSLVSLL